MDPNIASVFDPKHNSRFLADFHNFFTHQTMADVCFICKNGQKVKAHQMVLGVVSKLLKKILLEFSGTMQDIVIHLPDVPASSLKLVLYFLYEGATRLDGVAEYQEFQSVLNLLGIEPDNSNSAARQDTGVSVNTQQIPAQTPQAALGASNYLPAGEPMSNPPPYSASFAPQGPNSTDDYHSSMNQQSMGQFAPATPASQQQISPYKIMNQPESMHESLPSEPAHRKSTGYVTSQDHINPKIVGPSNNDLQFNIANQFSSARPLKRKQAPQNPDPTKQQNVSIKREHIENSPTISSRVNMVNDSAQVPTTARTMQIQPPRPNQTSALRNSVEPKPTSELRNFRGKGRGVGSSSSRTPLSNVPSVSRNNNKSGRPGTDDCVVVDE